MITRIVIEHFKSIEYLNLKLGNLTVLVGPNAIGKSNIVDAVMFVRDTVRHGLDRAVSERHGIDSIRQWTHKGARHVIFTVHVEGSWGDGYLSFTLGSTKGNYVIKREDAQWKEIIEEEPIYDEEGDQYIVQATEIKRRYVRDADGKVAIYTNGERRRSVRAPEADELFLNSSWRYMPRGLVSNISQFEAFSIFPNTLRQPQKPSSDRTLNASGNNLASIFKLMQRTKRGRDCKADILKALRYIMPNLENIRIQSVAGMVTPMFRVLEHEGKVHDFNVSQISDGTLRVLGLLTALYQPHKPDTLAVEEPEQTVHPGALGVVADALKEVAERTRVLVTTHSPEFVDHFDPKHIRAVEMVKGVTQVGEISAAQKEAVKERLFSLGELMTREGLHS